MTDQLMATINEVANQTGFSGAVRVSVRGSVAVDAAFGLADRANNIPSTTATRFGVASGGKLFTALAVGSLIDDGTLQLDARVRDVVTTALPNVTEDVTIDHLLTHTSGVYDYYDEELVDDFDAFELAVPCHKLLGPRDYVPMLVAGAQKFEPGARFSYSNGGYVLLGLALEDAAGVGYHRAVAERVFERAGMSASGFFRFDQLPGRVAVGYIDDDDRWRTNIYNLPIIGGPDGGAYSTVADLERLWAALHDGRILSASLTASVLEPTAAYKPGVYYGRGVWIHDHGAAPVRHYVEGCDAGVSFKSTRYAQGTVATIMSNATEGAWPMSDAIDAALTSTATRA